MSYGLVLQTFSTDKTNTAATTTGKKTDLDACALEISALHFSSCNSVENENETAKKKKINCQTIDLFSLQPSKYLSLRRI